MIKIKRGEIPENSGLRKRGKEELQKIRELANSRRLKSDDFRNRRLWSKFKKLLYELHHGKCCYCERKLSRGQAQVEHFRPKAKVDEDKHHPGYWWLAYSWRNLLLACGDCNTKKGAKFPLETGSKRLNPEDCDLEKEEPILINPLEEDPEEFIEYDLCAKLMVKALGKCERGEKTVTKLTGINDTHMMQERARKLQDYEDYKLWAGLKNEKCRARKRLREYISSSSQFSGFAKFYFKKMGYL